MARSLKGGSLMRSKRQNIQLELAFGEVVRGEALSRLARGTEDPMARSAMDGSAAPPGGGLMEAIVARDNLKDALRQVKRNKGAPGVDGMTVAELTPYLREHWPAIRAQLLDGTYRPQPVRRVEIPKPGGGVRALGIPTVLDRFIQQAVMQVLQAEWDRTFSEASFGFRPGLSAHQAVERAQAYIASGHYVVVDIDLEKFFDRVNHDILMGLVAKRVADKRLLKLIRGFLTAGVMEGGLASPTEEGTPQGGPLSPRSRRSAAIASCAMPTIATSMCAVGGQVLSPTSALHNPPNRRIRTRMSGGVGGEASRDAPLSRLGDSGRA